MCVCVCGKKKPVGCEMSTNDTAKTASSNAQVGQVGKQWWKVCFLYGNQEKYYRQIYAKAASERIAQSQQNGTGVNQGKSAIIFPTKQHRPILVTGKKDADADRPAPASKKRVTVLDDSFLLGVSEDEQRSDSGINIDASNQPDEPPPPLINRGMRRNFHLSSEELRMLNSDRPPNGVHTVQSSPPPPVPPPAVPTNPSPIVTTGSSGNSQITPNSSSSTSSSPVVVGSVAVSRSPTTKATHMLAGHRPDVLDPTTTGNPTKNGNT